MCCQLAEARQQIERERRAKLAAALERAEIAKQKRAELHQRKLVERERERQRKEAEKAREKFEKARLRKLEVEKQREAQRVAKEAARVRAEGKRVIELQQAQERAERARQTELAHVEYNRPRFDLTLEDSTPLPAPFPASQLLRIDPSDLRDTIAVRCHDAIQAVRDCGFVATHYNAH